MSWIFIALLAQFILGTSAVFDKLLLLRRSFDPWVYTFWIGIFGGFMSLCVALFGFTVLPAQSLLTALAAGVIFIGGLFFLFAALARGYASTTFTVIGALAPVATLAIGSTFFRYQLWGADLIGFIFLVCGGLLFFAFGKRAFDYAGVALMLGSIVLFGLYTILAKTIFEHNSFITGFVWIKLGALAAVVFSLAIPPLRRRVVVLSRESVGRYRMGYAANLLYAGLGSFLINAAISLAHPALVDATQSFKYAVIFIVAWFVLGEQCSGRELAKKIAAIILIMLGMLWLGVTQYARNIPVDAGRHITWGVTFSSKFSRALELDPRVNLEAIVRELRPRRIRVAAYWDEIERVRGVYDFSDLDWQIAMMRDAGIEAVIAVGMRVPRWPECHIPDWTRGLATKDREDALAAYLEVAITRYRSNPALAVWQLENEPFLSFGECPERGADFFERELALLKSFDAATPVLVTDSGEFGGWHRAVKSGDIFGTTMYRRVYPPSVGHITGIIDYPIGPSFFRFRARVARFLTGERTKPFIVSELQAEPWAVHELPDVRYEEHLRIFPPEYFEETIRFAIETGFSEYYLWGAEWWYAMRQRGNGRYWDTAARLIRGNSTF